MCPRLCPPPLRAPLSQEYGGAPAPTDEDSITFKSFLDSLDKGLVARVEFRSGGNKAYAFLKGASAGTEGERELTRIRIGEGYPEEQNNGWSSPLWVIRALRDRNVSAWGNGVRTADSRVLEGSWGGRS